MDTGLPFPPWLQLLGISNYLQNATNSRCAPTSALRPASLSHYAYFFSQVSYMHIKPSEGGKMGNGNLPFNMLPHASPEQLYTHNTLDWT